MESLFILIIGIAGLGLVVYALLPTAASKIKKDKTKPLRYPQEPPVYSGQQQTKAPGTDFDLLKNELESLKANYAVATTNLEAAKKKEEELKGELEKREQWVKKDQDEIRRLQEEKTRAENELKNKQKELTEQFNQNVDLARQIREINLKYESLEKENKERLEGLERLKYKIEAHVKEINSRADEIRSFKDTIAQMQKKETESEWISKREFNALNEEYTNLEKEFNNSEEKLRVRGEKINELNREIQQLKEQLNKLSSSQRIIEPEKPEQPKAQENIPAAELPVAEETKEEKKETR